MRELLFRAWSKTLSRYVVNGFTFFGEWLTFNCFEQIVNENWEVFSKVYENHLVATNDFIIEQYTGLKDKNGKMIFEGDICSYNTPEYRDDGHYYKSKRETGIVTFDYKGVSFGGWQAFTPFGGCVTEYEIIGNVYDNEQV